MRLRHYSHQTIKAYAGCLRSDVRFIQPKRPRNATEQGIRQFLFHLIDDKRYAAGTINQAFNALRLLYVDVYHTPFVIGTLPRPRKEHRLPDVMNEAEVAQLFRSVENLKHRTMLMLAYASGLRVRNSFVSASKTLMESAD